MTTDIAPAWVPTGRTLTENEAIIARGIDGFIETGMALADVRETGQYREAKYDSFSAYLTGRWPQLSRAQAYRAIDTARVAGLLSPIGDTPTNEAQAREIAPLRDDPDAMRDVWQQARAEHGDNLTAQDIRAAVHEYLGPDENAGTEATYDQALIEVEPSPGRPIELQDFLTALADAPRWGLLSYTPQALVPPAVFWGDGDSIRQGLALARAWLEQWENALADGSVAS